MVQRTALRVDLRSLALLLALCACADGDADAGGPERVSEAARYGGTAVVALNADLGSLNPLALQAQREFEVAQFQLFTPLVRYDASLRVQPRLAARWDTVRVGRDSLDLTFHLRGDVKWHDGVPTTARDVLFAFRRMTDPETAFAAVALLRGYSRNAVVLDDSTVRFRLRPFPEFLEIWTLVGGLPEHLLGDVPPAQASRAPYGQRPVGNGPLRWAARVPGESWTLEANPDYPAALGGRPYLDRIVYRVVPEPATRLTEIGSGGADLGLVNGEQVPQVKTLRGVRLATYLPPAWVYVAWNTKRPPFSDARVRRALSLAIDRHDIVQGVAMGYGVEGRTTVTPVHWAFDSTRSAATPSQRRAEAARLLDEAGWRDRDGSGVRTNAAGQRFRFVLKCSNGTYAYCDLAQAVQAHLRRVAVDAEIRREEFQTLLSELTHPAAAGGGRDFEAAMFSFVDAFGETGQSYLGSAARDDPFAFTGYTSPVLDSLFAEMDHTLDRGAAMPLWRRYQAEVDRAAPYAVLYYPESTVAVSERLQGVEMDARGPLVSSTRWWIAPRLRR